MSEILSNWAKNYTYQSTSIHRPTTVEEVQELVAGAQKVKALGSRHSFNEIADTTGDLVSTERLDKVLSLDADRRTVTVEAGIKYGELARFLDQSGFALSNMASLPHISVAGACATGTHGSGVGNKSLSAAMSALEFVAADGSLVSLSREQDGERFPASVVALGGLGVATSVTLDVVPAFRMRQNLFEGLPFGQLERHFDDIMSSAYSVSLFTDWSASRINQVWVKQLVASDTPKPLEVETYGARPATRNLHPIGELSAVNCTEQMGVVGPWHERLPHFRMDFTPSSGEELQTEYLFPRHLAWPALQAIDEMRDKISPLIQVTEIRTIAADDLWMSPSYGQDSVAIHFTWIKDWEAVRQLLPSIESKLAAFGARPHWGKLFTMPAADVQTRYEKFGDFRKLLETYDPNGKFRNAFLDRNIFSS